MADPLRRCTHLWGTARYSDAPPGLRRYGRATYLPFRGQGSWGLFARGRRLGAGVDPAAGEGLPAAEPQPCGPTLYIGPLITHYGHFLINTLPRLWPLAEWAGPRPRLLCHHLEARAGWAGLGFLGTILARLGYTLDDVLTFDRPSILDDVVVPEPALVEQASVHAAFGGLCRLIGAPFWDAAEVDTVARPVYLSKTRLGGGINRIVNEGEIAAELERSGVDIAYPETLDLPEQVRLLSRRRIVLGSVGSAFHTTAFAAPGRRLVGLNWQPALNANFALLDRLTGARGRYYHARGTLYRAPGTFQVSWEVPDPAAVARALLARAERLERGEPDRAGGRPWSRLFPRS